MNRNPVGWFEIYVNDMQRAKSFYSAVLDVTLSDLNVPGDEVEMWAFPMNEEMPGAAGSLVYMQGAEAGGSSTIVYFSSDDCSTEESRIAAAGGEVFRSKFSIGEYGYIVLAYDTEGNMFGLHSMN